MLFRSVTLVEAAPHILAPFDSDMVTIAEKELEDHGVSLILEDGVKSFNNNEGKVSINLSSGKKLDADMVILAIGVIPDTGFLRDTGIEFGDKGHIVVDKYMNTNVEDVYAVGDAILVKDFINGNSTAIPLAGPANRQGRIVADNIYGIKSEYKGTLGTSIIKVFDMAAASTGNNERNLKKLQIPYKVIYAHPNSHAGYYPGAVMMSIKLIFNEEGKILGSQILGYDGVDKTIDVIATVIKLNGTVKDLTELELAYAPPYSSAKSPANMMGFIAENVLEDRMDILNIEDINDFNQNKEILLDVRDQVEVENGSIDKAINIPVNDLRNRMNELDKEKEIWVYCRVGLRGYIASRILTQNGFKVKNLTGGYESIKKANFKPLEINKSNIKDDDKTLIKLKDKEFDKEIDASGLCCPGPLMSLKNSMDKLEEGKILSIKASDPGFYEDVQSWCKNTGNQLLDLKREGGMIKAYIKKKPKEVTKDEDNKELVSTQKDGKTMVVFSGELDKAIASFIIANGASSMGKKVTMFFTFWGINILRKDEKVPTKKKFMEKAFGFMMPRGSKKLKLSNMNMAGMGPKVIRKLMQDKNVSSLEELITAAIDSGIEIVACQMSMDLLGLKKEELIDGVKIAGVGYYLGEAEESNVNLFI